MVEITAKKIELLEQEGHTIEELIPDYVDENGNYCDPDHEPINEDDFCYPSGGTDLIPLTANDGSSIPDCVVLHSFGRTRVCCDWHDGDGEMCSHWHTSLVSGGGSS